MLRQEWADLLQKGFSPIHNPHRWNREQAKQGHAPTLQNVLRKVSYHEAQDAKPVRNSIVFEVFYASWIPCRGTIGRFAGLYSWHRHLMKDTGNEKCQLALYNNNSIEKCKLTLNESYRFIRYHHDFCMFKTSLMLYAKYDRNKNNICLFNLFLMLTPVTSCNCDVCNSGWRDRWNGRSYEWSRPADEVAPRRWLVARPARYFTRASYRRLRATTGTCQRLKHGYALRAVSLHDDVTPCGRNHSATM